MGGKNSYESIKRYQDKVYDSLTVRIKKGEKAVWQEYAKQRGQSLNAFIAQAVRERIDREA